MTAVSADGRTEVRRRVIQWLTRGAIAAVLITEVLYYIFTMPLVNGIAAAVSALSLLLVWRWPYISLAANIALIPLGGPVPLALLLAFYMVTNSRRFRWTTLVATVGVFAAAFVPRIGRPGTQLLVDVMVCAGVVAITAMIGNLVFTRRELLSALSQLDESHQRERLASAQHAVDLERSRISREMHDVVSHQVSLIAVHAAAIQVGSEDHIAKDGARTIRRLSVDTLAELRYVLALLQPGDDEGAGLPPPPGVADLSALIDQSGIDVQSNISIAGELDSALGQSLHRIVQEALTNIRKHAPGASARVSLFADGDLLVLVVENTPATARATELGDALPGSGRGLIGMSERAALLGGVLLAGPTPEGGFRITVKVPQRT